MKKDQLDGAVDYILKYPDKLINFAEHSNYDLKVIVLGEDYSTEFYEKPNHIHLDHAEFIDDNDIW